MEGNRPFQIALVLQELASKKRIKMPCGAFCFTSCVRREDVVEQRRFMALLIASHTSHIKTRGT
jgi:hypothetical protein